MRNEWTGILACTFLAGCTATTNVNNTPSRPSTYEPIDRPGRVATGVGIESQDIVAMTDRMLRDLLAQPQIAGRERPPRIIVDSQYFENESSSRLNKNLITDRLRVELQRAAAGRMLFVGRENIRAVEDERALKEAEVVDRGTLPAASATAGADFRLTGRISSLDKINPATGDKARYNQIVFEMLDLERGFIVWSGIYEFQKSGHDDVIYR